MTRPTLKVTVHLDTTDELVPTHKVFGRSDRTFAGEAFVSVEATPDLSLMARDPQTLRVLAAAIDNAAAELEAVLMAETEVPGTDESPAGAQQPPVAFDEGNRGNLAPAQTGFVTDTGVTVVTSNIDGSPLAV